MKEDATAMFVFGCFFLVVSMLLVIVHFTIPQHSTQIPSCDTPNGQVANCGMYSAPDSLAWGLAGFGISAICFSIWYLLRRYLK